MLKRFAPLVPIAFSLLLAACAGAPTASKQSLAETPRFPTSKPISYQLDPAADKAAQTPAVQEDDEALDEIADSGESSDIKSLLSRSYELPALSSLLKRGFTLIGTPYRSGGTSVATGFDCSGFVNFLFREQVGIELPRSSRDLAQMPGPKVAKSELKPGDLVFFARRGRINHTGIYIGDGEFLHSSSHRSGGVRVDKLAGDYWNSHYLTAKRVLDSSN